MNCDQNEFISSSLVKAISLYLDKNYIYSLALAGMSENAFDEKTYKEKGFLFSTIHQKIIDSNVTISNIHDGIEELKEFEHDESLNHIDFPYIRSGTLTEDKIKRKCEQSIDNSLKKIKESDFNLSHELCNSIGQFKVITRGRLIPQS